MKSSTYVNDEQDQDVLNYHIDEEDDKESETKMDIDEELELEPEDEFAMDLKLEQIRVKEYLEPAIIATLLEFNEYIKQYEGLFYVVTGGEAANIWFDYQIDELRTDDFDIKIFWEKQVYDLIRYKKREINAKENNKKAIISIPEEYDEILETATQWLLNKLVKNLLNYKNEYNRNKDDKNQYDFWIQPEENLRKVDNNRKVIQYEYNYAGQKFEANLIDITPLGNSASITVPEYRKLFPKTDYDIHDSPIPYIYYYQIPYTALGHLIWDLNNTLEAIRLGLYLEDKQLRYEQKLEIILEQLNVFDAINNNLLDSLIEDYSNNYRNECLFWNREVTKEEIIRQGILENIFPNNPRFLNELEQRIGKQYLCKYYKTTKRFE